MIFSEAQVERCEGDFAWVKIRPHSPCGNCDPKTGCKSVSITRLFGQGQQSYPVKNPLHARPNDFVKVAVNEGDLLGTAVWAYGFPLILLILGAVLGSALAYPPHDELYSLMGAVLGFLLSFVVLRMRNEKAKATQPSIVEILPNTIQLKNCSGK
jgi:sigma-E factor negative regulatory protein RseC